MTATITRRQVSHDISYHARATRSCVILTEFPIYHATAKMLKIGTKERDPVIEMFPSSKHQQYYKVRVCRKKQ